MASVGSALLGLGGLGAALHIAGSVLIVFGQASVKVAHSIVDSTGAPSTWSVPRAHPHTVPLWRRPDGKWRRQKAGSKAYAFGGWAAFALGNVLRFVAMRFAAQTVLSGLGSLQFVIIPVASRFMLGIRASGSTALGVTVVLLGNALIILYGPGEVTFTLEELRRQWATPAMSTFLVALGSLLCLLQWLHWRLTSSAGGALLQPHLAAAMEGGGALGGKGAAGGGAAAGSAADGGHFASNGVGGGIMPLGGSSNGLAGLAGFGGGRESDAVMVFAGALLFSAVASFVGAWSVLFSKSLTYVASYLPGSLGDWYSWFVLAAFLATAAFWVRQSDRGLRYYPASLIMPLMQAFWMCMSVIEGGIYFDELAGLPSRHLALLMLGLLLALLGAIFMGVAGFIAEQPQHIFRYSAASSELDASAAAAAGALSPPPLPEGVVGGTATVSVIVEDKLGAAAAARRVDPALSNPVLRSAAASALAQQQHGHGLGAPRNGFLLVEPAGAGGGGGLGDDAELAKSWRWQQAAGEGGGGSSHGASARSQLLASPPPGHLELPPLGAGPAGGGNSAGTPGGGSPTAHAAYDRMQAVRSPTQQLLSRESSACLDGPGSGAAQGQGRHGSAFERALKEAGGDGSSGGSGGGLLWRQGSVLLDSLTSLGAGRGPLLRR